MATLTPEAIVAIVGLVIALPPTVVVVVRLLWRWYGTGAPGQQHMSNSQDEEAAMTVQPQQQPYWYAVEGDPRLRGDPCPRRISTREAMHITRYQRSEIYNMDVTPW
ncbi:hypothetical protein J3459_006786 [Metarhizium acridum]|uniref:uncharacterized protein n=1 Tax=Metarhizium acridum TaxID=92637 RepID=UPI001C6C8D14|nr:hypothetical protein J3458_019165 [Metarhizium acridum]KAG8427317.1 hypothetical protein J3459_006786 [Metarhizium acridum]